MNSEQGTSSKLVTSIILILAFISTLVAIAGSIIFFVNQFQNSPSFLFPLPGLVLIDWAALGILGFFGVYFGVKQTPTFWSRIAWVVIGAFLPLIILGAFSIGFFVFISLSFFLASTILISILNKNGTKWLNSFGLVMLGALCNLGLLYIFIVLGNAFH
jgi:hypothetical protein